MASIKELLFPLRPRRDGAANHLAPYRFAVEAASRIPAAKLVSIDTGGHIFMGHGNEVREAIQAFVRAAA
jgi:hypothetical protein